MDNHPDFYANLHKGGANFLVDNLSKMVENVKKAHDINKKSPIFPQTYVWVIKLSTILNADEYSFGVIGRENCV